jgi:hypothetical protein
MQHATEKQGKSNFKAWQHKKQAANANAHEKFMQYRSNSFKLGARISPEVFNALLGTFSR